MSPEHLDASNVADATDAILKGLRDLLEPEGSQLFALVKDTSAMCNGLTMAETQVAIRLALAIYQAEIVKPDVGAGEPI